MSDRSRAGPFQYNLEGRFYADPELYQQERAKIFRRAWQPIGAASAVAARGSYLAATIAGYQIVVHRGMDDMLRAFENVCPHRGAQLVPVGSGSCDRFRCPYHGWAFATDGQVEDTPWFGEPSPFDLTSLRIPPIGVAQWRGLVFVAIDPDGSLAEQLGDLPEEAASAPMESFEIGASRRFRADVNWKAYLDQFIEFYHAPTVHSPDKSVGIDQYDVRPRHGMMLMTAPRGDASDAAYYGGRWLWGWPNWTVSFFPGGMKTSRVDPLSSTSCEIEFGYYFADMSDAAAPLREQVAIATESIFGEDIVAASRAQANYSSSAYRGGPLHPRLERAVAYFQARVREALDGETANAAALLDERDRPRT